MRIFRILILIALCFSLAKTYAQNDNPYEIFGYQGNILKTPEEESGKQYLILNTNDTTQRLKSLVFNTKSKLIEYIDHNGCIFKTDSIMPTIVLRFLSIDPNAKDYPSLNPYNFVGNMPTRAIDPDGRSIYILFSTIGNSEYGSDNMLFAAMQTRRQNIESSASYSDKYDRVFSIPITDIGEIKSYTERIVKCFSGIYGQTIQVGVFSHASFDGPRGSVTSSIAPFGNNKKQMDLFGGWDAINFNWAENGASMTFYGCRTATDYNEDNKFIGSFAQKVSFLPNFNNVEVAGQTTYSFPSIFPDKRVTNIARSAYPSIGFTYDKQVYMVGGNKQKLEGIDALWFTPMSAPSANPMNVYKNGHIIGSGSQSTTNKSAVDY